MFYRERLKEASGMTSSLWGGCGKMFASNESGQTSFIKAGDEAALYSLKGFLSLGHLAVGDVSAIH